MTMYDYVRLCTTMYDDVRRCTTMYDDVRRCTTMYDDVRRCTAMYDDVNIKINFLHGQIFLSQRTLLQWKIDMYDLYDYV